MSRFRSQRFKTASRSTHITVESGLIEFIAYHERKGSSKSYVGELRSYLLGGQLRFGVTRPRKPILTWSREQRRTTVADLDRAALGAYLDHVRSLATRDVYAKLCAILKRMFDFFVLDGILEELPMRLISPND